MLLAFCVWYIYIYILNLYSCQIDRHASEGDEATPQWPCWGHACLFALSRLAGGRRCDYHCSIILSLLERIALSGNAFGNQRKEMTKICALAFISATFPLLVFFSFFPLIFPFALKTFRWSNNDLSPFHKNLPSGMLGFHPCQGIPTIDSIITLGNP